MRSTVARLGMWLMGLRRRRPVPPLRGTPIPGGLVHALFCSIFLHCSCLRWVLLPAFIFFVGTYRGQQLDEDALNEYGKQFSGYEGPTLKALDNLPYVVVALAVVGAGAGADMEASFVSAVVGVFTAAAATVSTQLLKNTLVKPNYGVQEAVLNSALADIPLWRRPQVRLFSWRPRVRSARRLRCWGRWRPA